MTAASTTSTQQARSETGLSARQRLLLALILTGQFMAVLDASIVNVAIPTIRRDLHATGAELQLIVASYVIAYAVLLITGARLGQRFGFRRAFIAGLAIFTGASLACGLAPDSQTLIVVRAIQGAGAALMVPQVFSLIQRNFAGPTRAQALSLWAATLALGGLVGQVLGGILVTADLFGTGWRPVFLVNVPIGLLLLAASIRLLPVDVPAPARPLDLGGLISLAAAVLLLVVPLVLGNEEGWPAWAFASLALSAVAIVVFALIERHVERSGGAPLIAARVVRAPGMPAALVAIVLALASYGGFLFTFTQHLQLGLRDSPLQAGLTFVPMAVGFALASLNWRRLPVAWHQLVIPAGCVIAVGRLFADGDRCVRRRRWWPAAAGRAVRGGVRPGHGCEPDPDRRPVQGRTAGRRRRERRGHHGHPARTGHRRRDIRQRLPQSGRAAGNPADGRRDHADPRAHRRRPGRVRRRIDRHGPRPTLGDRGIRRCRPGRGRRHVGDRDR